VYPSRRHLLLLGAAFGLAACGGGDGDDPPTETVSEEDAESDIALLNNLLDLEYTEITARAAAARLLRGEHRRAARRSARQERAHAEELTRAVRGLGGTPNSSRPAREYAADFPPLTDATEALEFLLDVESTAVAAYLDTLPKINTPRLRATVASTLTAEAEHLAVVLGNLRRAQAPEPFVTGDL
jgi:bacterioferritin (cytochrome b1)